MRRVVTIEDVARLERGEAETLEQIDESPGASRGRDRLIEDVKEMLGAFPRRDCVFVNMVAAINDHVVEQLTDEIEHRADRDVRDQLGFFDALGRGEQIETRRVLGQRRLELDGIELMVEPHQRHDGHFGIEVQKNRQAAGLKIEIDQSDSLMQRS